MAGFRSRLFVASALVLTLAGCAAQPVSKTKLLTEPHFWERSDTSSAIYQRGPKAQQMLHRDIARCVTEIRELERLGAIRVATPADTMQDGTVPDPDSPAGSLAQWETPERDGYLRAEHLEYHDFETCMMDKGWMRIEHVPYDVAEEGRETYIEAITGEQYQTRVRPSQPFMSKPKSDFENLNQ